MTAPARSDGSRSRRRGPRLAINWVAFLGTGILLGMIIGGLVHVVGPAAAGYGKQTSVLFFAAFGALIGGLVAGVVGVIADAVLSRR